ncbi:MAG: hypothetical protein DRJ01_01260 [Bacteroidetes bacterium]|nr:MAG: hypothetical protein DRJ01_01260 [Bacteroidota bacterium]
MLQFLKKSYPFNDDLRHNAKIIFFISLGVLAFLLIFQPIEISSFSKKEIFYLVTGLAVSTFLVLSFNLIILPSLFPKIFRNNGWNIKKEIIWNLWILLAISSSDFMFYSKLFGVFDINFNDIVKIILLGVLPVAVLIIINQERLLKAHLKSAQQLNKKLIESKQQKEKFINFESDYKKDKLIIKLNSLILIKSADNYIEVYYESNGLVKKQMIRTTLQKAQELIHEYDFIVRCHRTFIVNINRIDEIQGNSQGYKLFFKNIDFPAIVSQKYINEFSKLI